jgi:Ca-activated chloride channel family protein
MLVDTSGSMKPKLSAVQQAIHDFSISLRSRSGASRMAVCSFPGKQKYLDVRIPWTDQVEKAHQLTSGLSMSGITPTGPAIVEAIALFEDVPLPKALSDRYRQNDDDTEGSLQDHVF